MHTFTKDIYAYAMEIHTIIYDGGLLRGLATKGLLPVTLKLKAEGFVKKKNWLQC